MMPPLPPGPVPSQLPPIAQLLYREGDAWTALLSLHTSVVSTMQQITNAMAMETFGDSDSDRELQYCAALSQAAAQCDTLHTEIMKLRTLRKTRVQYDNTLMHTLLSAHTRETLAVGSSLALQASISLQTVASEVRTSIQEFRKLEAELSSLNEALASYPSYSIPSDFKIHLSTQLGNSELALSDFVTILKKHTKTEDGRLNMHSLLEDDAFSSVLPPSLDRLKCNEGEEGEEGEEEGDAQSSSRASTSCTNLKSVSVPIRRSGDKQKLDR